MLEIWIKLAEYNFKMPDMQIFEILLFCNFIMTELLMFALYIGMLLD
jgi:hypothetical protein